MILAKMASNGSEQTNRRGRRGVNLSIIEDSCEDVGKTLHVKDGQVVIEVDEVPLNLYFFIFRWGLFPKRGFLRPQTSL